MASTTQIRDTSSVLRIITLGEISTGTKTSLILRFVKNEFYDSPEPNIGVAFMCKKVKISELELKLEIWGLQQ